MDRWFKKIAYERAADLLLQQCEDADLVDCNVELFMKECELTEDEALAILKFIAETIVPELRAKDA